MATPNILGLTSMTPKVFYSGQLASGDTAICTAGANESIKLKPLILCNTSSSPVTVSAGIIPSGGTVDGTHKVLSNYQLAANETIVVDEIAGQFLDAGAKVNVNAGTGSAVDATLTGVSML